MTQSSRSDWELRESSDSEMTFTVHATDTTATDSFVTDIVFVSKNTMQTVGGDIDGYDSFGDSTLDIAADGTKHHVRQDQTFSGDLSGMTLGYGGAEVTFSMGSNSGSSMQSTHRLDETFANGVHTGYEWHKSKGSGASSSSSSISVYDGAGWNTNTNFASDTTELTLTLHCLVIS